MRWMVCLGKLNLRDQMANKTFSLSQEGYDLIMDYSENKSELINSLILSHFKEEQSTNPDKLLIKKQDQVSLIEIANLKIKQLDEQINFIKEKEMQDQEKQDIKIALDEFNKRGEEVKDQFFNQKTISEEEYWEIMNERELEKKTILKSKGLGKHE